MTKLPKFHEPYLAWTSQDSDTRSVYMGIDGRVSIADLLNHIDEITPGLREQEIFVNYATARWERPATQEELDEREVWRHRHDEKRDVWERETYDRLKAKFDPKE